MRVDAQEHPIGIFWSSKLYEVQKYLSLSNHGYTPLIVVMNKAKFDALSLNYKKRWLKRRKKPVNSTWFRQLEKEIIENLRKEGVEVTETIDKAPFKAIVEDKVRKSFIDQNGDELIKQVDALAQ